MHMAAAGSLAAGSTNFTPALILLVILIPICGAIAIAVWSHSQLQKHRADAVAMASYRKLAEEAVANMAEVRAEIAKLTEHVDAVERLMRDVG
jgi:predicted negative regulator of RcsB-dependent stress response